MEIPDCDKKTSELLFCNMKSCDFVGIFVCHSIFPPLVEGAMFNKVISIKGFSLVVVVSCFDWLIIIGSHAHLSQLNVHGSQFVGFGGVV